MLCAGIFGAVAAATAAGALIMAEMTSHERYQRIFLHREADRVPIMDGPWPATIERWQREGMPTTVSYVDFFGLDHIVSIGADSSPRYPVAVVEETAEYRIASTPWGVTMKNWKHAASTPQYLGFTVVDRTTWQAAKARMQPSRDRINWDHLKANYRNWREKGYWIQAGLWFGFDVTHSWIIGTETMLIAMAEDPEWVRDIIGHELEVSMKLLDLIWAEGYTFDEVRWPDDMGYKGHTFFSTPMYRDLVLPFQKQAIDWAHAKGIWAQLHSCGNITPFVPLLVEAGLDALNPLEVKAGMDPLALKRQYGDRLSLHGGLNAMLWDKPDLIRAEMERLVPVLKQNGGYILSSDHSVPSSVSLQDFRGIVELGKRLGSYA
jgi:uroporphyrinogen decarboxylase